MPTNLTELREARATRKRDASLPDVRSFTATRQRDRDHPTRDQLLMETVDCVVIGAGVVGLAVARALACAGRDVVVLESADAIGTGASSRNSEVIHAGLYYAPGSLKARLCIRGRQQLYAYCGENGVSYRRCGKIIVAVTEAEHGALNAITARSLASGVTTLRRITQSEARALEPALECSAALLSPETGIIDSHGLMRSLRRDAERAGALFALRCAFVGAARHDGAWIVESADGAVVASRWLLNCAGLAAQSVAHSMTGFPRAEIPRQYIAKGHYFALAGVSPFSRLVYPIPADGGLGIHLTLDLAGRARFGPDVEWVTGTDASRDFAVDAARANLFAESIRRYWPAITADLLQPAYSGLRTKLSGPGEPPVDFRIDGPAEHGIDGIVHLFGIESPGLTASLAIGDHVLDVVQRGHP